MIPRTIAVCFLLLTSNVAAEATEEQPADKIYVTSKGLLLVTNTGASTVSVIDTKNDNIVNNIKVPVTPEGISFKNH